MACAGGSAGTRRERHKLPRPVRQLPCLHFMSRQCPDTLAAAMAEGRPRAGGRSGYGGLATVSVPHSATLSTLSPSLACSLPSSPALSLSLSLSLSDSFALSHTHLLSPSLSPALSLSLLLHFPLSSSLGIRNPPHTHILSISLSQSLYFSRSLLLFLRFYLTHTPHTHTPP